MVHHVAVFGEWEDPLYLAMGQLVVTYNSAEETIKTLLTNLASDFQVDHYFHGRIMTSELGSVGIENALKAIAGDILPRAEREAVVYLADFYERVRGYRNFYVHGVVQPAVPVMDRDTVGGHVANYSAKGALAEHTTIVTLDELQLATDRVHALKLFAAQTLKALRDRAKPNGAFAPTPLPDRPPLPPRLVKPRLNLRDFLPPPEA